MKCFFGRYEEYPFFSFCFGLTYFKLIDQKFDSPIHMLRFDFVLHIFSDKGIRAIVNDENVRIGQPLRHLVEEFLEKKNLKIRQKNS